MCAVCVRVCVFVRFVRNYMERPAGFTAEEMLEQTGSLS